MHRLAQDMVGGAVSALKRHKACTSSVAHGLCRLLAHLALKSKQAER